MVIIFIYLSLLSAAWPASSLPGGRLKCETQIIELVQNNESRKGAGITHSHRTLNSAAGSILMNSHSALLSDPREQSRPAPMLLIMQFSAHQMMPLLRVLRRSTPSTGHRCGS